MNLLRRIGYLLGTAPVDAAANRWAVGFVAMILPFVAVAAVSLTAGTTPTVAIADEEKPVKTVEQDRNLFVGDLVITAEEEKPVKTDEFNVKVGDRVGMKISGDLFREFMHLVLPNNKVEPGDIEFFIGTVKGNLPEGRCRIEYTEAVARGEKTRQLFSMTAVVQRSQIKMPPLAIDNRQLAIVDGKTVVKRVILGVSNDKAENSAPDKFEQRIVYTEKPKRDYYYLELSELKGVKFKLWELKKEVGE